MRRTVQLVQSVVTALALTGCGAFAPGSLEGALVPFQPDIAQGGRAISIAVHPTDASQILVASETGGLFKTLDGGRTWAHIDRLPSHLVSHVAYAPGDPQVVITVTRRDYLDGNSGIWRSVDGGSTWEQPASATPSTGARCESSFGAHSVSFAPGSDTVYVGTACGLAVSTDMGATWTHEVLGTGSQNTVWSVHAGSGGQVNAATRNGLWFTGDAGATWNLASTGPAAGAEGFVHALASSPYDSNHVFFTVDHKLYLSTNGGDDWKWIDAPSSPMRESFVRIGNAWAGEAGPVYDVFYGDGTDLFRRGFRHSTAGPIAQGEWASLTTDHADPADMGFDNTLTNRVHRVPVLLATDGGVHRSPDGGTTWILTGSGPDGFDALQVTEITGQVVGGATPHHDLYFGTQDNKIYGSSDGGRTWPAHIDSEGFHIRVPAQSDDHANAKVTGVKCASCVNFIADEHLDTYSNWPNPPDGDSDTNDVDGNVFLIPPDHYIQKTVNDDDDPTEGIFKLTEDYGQTWREAFRLTDARYRPYIVGQGDEVTIYQVVMRPARTPSGSRRRGLVRITGLDTTGSAVVTDADTQGLGSIGIFPAGFPWYPVLGASHTDHDHLIAADIETDAMVVSHDGGATWAADGALTDLVTGEGEYAFRRGRYTMATVVAFDPYNGCHILVGTVQRGIIRSRDGGRTWHRIHAPGRDKHRRLPWESPPVTSGIPYISSFYFPPTGPVVVSSYGRGLWKLDVERRATCGATRAAAAPEAPVAPTLVFLATGESQGFRGPGTLDACEACELVAVDHGHISGLEVKDGLLSSFSITSGTPYQFDEHGKLMPLSVPNHYQPLLGPRRMIAGRMKLPANVDGATIRGFVLQGRRLKALLVSKRALELGGGKGPWVRLHSEFNVNGFPLIQRGGAITIRGAGFVGRDGKAGPLRISIDDVPLAQSIAVDPAGRFRAEIQVPLPPGHYEIVAEQRQGNRLLRAEDTVAVIRFDEEG